MLNPREIVIADRIDGAQLIEVGEDIVGGVETTMVVIDAGDGQRSKPMPRETALAMSPYWQAPGTAVA